MYHNQGVLRYQEASITSMSPGKIVVLLYEKMISDLEEAVAAVEANNRIHMTQRLNHSQRIVSELRGALDHNVGGEISRNLESLYDYLFHEHLSMTVDQDPRHARDCIEVLRPLLDAWRQAPSVAAEQTGRAPGTDPNPSGSDPASISRNGHPSKQSGAGGPESVPGRTNLFSVSA